MCHVKLPFKTNWITFVLCVIAVVASELALAAPKEAKITKPKPPPALEVAMISPAFRNSIQSKDPLKELWLKCDTASGKSGRIKITLSNADDGTLIWQQSKTVKRRGRCEFRKSLDKLMVGQYTVKTVFHAGNGEILASQSLPLKVLSPALVEVTFDPRRICYVNGEAFFPIGLYHVSEGVLNTINKRAKEIGLAEVSLRQMLRDVKEHGFNCVHYSFEIPSETYMKLAKEVGLYIIPEVGGPGEGYFRELYEKSKHYDNILMWFGVDEAGSTGRLDSAIGRRDMFRRVDPHRPVSAATAWPREALAAFDFMMFNLYPIRHAPITVCSTRADKGLAAGNERVPVWMIPQAFGLDGLFSEPTGAELRCQAYLCLAARATGLIYYAYWTPETYSKNPKGRNQWFLPDSEMWSTFKKLNTEVQELAPILLFGQCDGPTKFNGAIYYNLWEYSGNRYLITSNPTGENQKALWTKAKTDSVTVMFEDRSIKPNKKGEFTDTYKPLEVHVYRGKIR